MTVLIVVHAAVKKLDLEFIYCLNWNWNVAYWKVPANCRECLWTLTRFSFLQQISLAKCRVLEEESVAERGPRLLEVPCPAAVPAPHPATSKDWSVPAPRPTVAAPIPTPIPRYPISRGSGSKETANRELVAQKPSRSPKARTASTQPSPNKFRGASSKDHTLFWWKMMTLLSTEFSFHFPKWPWILFSWFNESMHN